MLKLLVAFVSLLPPRARRLLVRRIFDTIWRAYTTETVYGREHIPDGPCLFICNHLSNADGYTLDRVFRPKEVFFLAGVKLQDTGMTRLGIEAVHTIPIRPNTPDIEALKRAVEHLKAGRSVLVFPEGTRSRTGGLLQAKKGAALIAKRAGVPIVPVALTGTEKFVPINDNDMGGEQPHRAHLTVRIGQPFQVSDLDLTVTEGDDVRQALADAMLRRVAALLPLEYQGAYQNSSN